MQADSQFIQVLGEQDYGIYDVIVIGAGCVGMAFTYIASTIHQQQQNKIPLNICLIQKQDILDSNRYWSSRFSARQNRIQYNEQYLVQYTKQSNKFWQQLQSKKNYQFNLKQGALWFGDISASTSQGSIVEANRTLQKANIDKLYIKNMINSQPKFLNNWKIDQNKDDRNGHNWQALYSEQGGSINMEKSYNYFFNEIKNRKNVRIQDLSVLQSYQTVRGCHQFRGSKKDQSQLNKKFKVTGNKIFIAAGIDTPDFIQNILKKGNQLKQQAIIQQYVASYFKIKQGWQQSYSSKNCPNFYHFLDPIQKKYKAGYGFPYHQWDSPQPNTIKIGTLASFPIKNVKNTSKQTNIPSTKAFLPNTSKQDNRVLSNQDYVNTYMNGLQQYAYKNYRCPMIFYDGRQTILDYLNRSQKSIVVQTGGWIGKYYPFLAKTAYKLLFQFNGIQYQEEMIKKSTIKQTKQITVMKNFLSRTRYPIRRHVQNLLRNPKNKLKQNFQYDTLIVGAGCSGLYSAFRLNQAKNQKNVNSHVPYKIGVFDMLDRISGRLWSVKFQGSKTPMELGGMRYIEQQHKLLVNMIRKLQMPQLPFQMKGDYLQAESLKCYLRKSRYSKNQWEKHHQAGQKFHTSFRLQEPLIGMNAVQIFTYSIYLILTADYNSDVKQQLNKLKNSNTYFDERVREIKKNSNWTDYAVQFTLEDWNFLKSKLKYKPKSLYLKGEAKQQPLLKFGFQNIIQNQFSHEVYQYASNQNGYFSLTSNESYIQHIVAFLLDFGSVTYKTLSGGFDMFNYNIANALLDQVNGITAFQGGIYLNHELINIEVEIDKKDKNIKKYLVTFENRETRNSIMVKAKNVILGMPKKSIEILYDKIPLLRTPISYQSSVQRIKNPRNLYQLLQSVVGMASIKIIINFKTNWWDITKKNPSLSTGQQMRGVSSTDLPIRQTLYFGTDSDNMLLASYNDKITTDYWSVLQDNFQPFQPYQDVPLTGTNPKYVGYGKRSRLCHLKKQNIAPASYQIVHQVLRQLRLSHGQAEGIDQRNVLQAMYQNWSQQPFGGGYHFWNPGYDVQKVMQTIRKPWNGQDGKRNENIFIVGQAYSNTTGWVQGALQTAQKMLQDHFKLQEYIPGYYKGW